MVLATELGNLRRFENPRQLMAHIQNTFHQDNLPRPPRRLVYKYQREPILGIGEILALTLLYEILNIGRFDSVQRFASYGRLVKCEKSSAGKRLGTSGHKLGRTVYLMLKRNQAFDADRFLANT